MYLYVRFDGVIKSEQVWLRPGVCLDVSGEDKIQCPCHESISRFSGHLARSLVTVATDQAIRLTMDECVIIAIFIGSSSLLLLKLARRTKKE